MRAPFLRMVVLALVGFAGSSAAAEFDWTPQPAPYFPTIVVDAVADRVYGFGALGVWVRPLEPDSIWRPANPLGTPPFRSYVQSPAVLDPARHRIVVAGGPLGDQVWSLRLDPVPTWEQLTTEGYAPANGPRHLFYDRHGDRLIAIARGLQSPDDDQYWQLTIGDTLHGSRVLPTGPGPIVRQNAQYTLDTLRSRIVLHGGGTCDAGTNCGPIYGDLWSLALDTATWSQVANGGVSMYSGWIVYDGARDRIVGSGGSIGHLLSARLWYQNLSGVALSGELDPANHSEIPTIDPIGDRLLAAKFLDLKTSMLASFPLAGGTTTEVDQFPGSPTVAPVPGSIAYDTRRQRLFGFGGLTADYPSNELWSLTASGQPVWTRVTPANGPEPRTGASLIVDPVRDQLVLYGGYTNTAEYFDTWTMSLTGTPEWHKLPTTASFRDYNAPACYDPVHDRMLVYANGMYALDLRDPVRWVQVPTTGTAPAAWANAGTLWDPVQDQWLVCNQGIYEFDVASSTWRNRSSGTFASSVSAAGYALDPYFYRVLICGGRLMAPPGSDVVYLHAVRMLPSMVDETVSIGRPGPALGWMLASAYDAERDRFLFAMGAGVAGGPPLPTPWTLDRSGTLAFDLQLPAVGAVSRGRITPIQVRVRSPFPPTMSYSLIARSERHWPPSRTRARIPAGGTFPVTLGIAIPDTAAPGDVQLVIEARPEGVSGGIEAPLTLTVVAGQATTVQSVTALPDSVTIVWASVGAAGDSVRFIRQLSGAPRETIGAAIVDGSGSVALVDRAVTPGTAPTYALLIQPELGGLVVGEVQVVIPNQPPPSGPDGFAFAVTNPTTDAIRYAITVPTAQPATAELFDIAGRMVAREPLGTLAPGTHPFTFSAAPPIAGLYWLRVTVGGHVETRRVALVK